MLYDAVGLEEIELLGEVMAVATETVGPIPVIDLDVVLQLGADRDHCGTSPTR